LPFVIRTVLSSTDPPFTWIDVVDPTRQELSEISQRYGLHPMTVADSLEPEHLPKYERIGGTTFIIVRAFDTASPGHCSTLHEMTRKVAIFYGADFLITIHRTEQPFLTALMEQNRRAAPPDGISERRKGFLPRLVIDLVNGAVATYEKPLQDAETAIDAFEATVFGEHELRGLLRRIYLVKRRVTLMRRMLSHTLDAVKKLVPGSEPTAPLYQDLRENVESMHFWAEELLEDVNNLLSIQLAMASHRTNEVVRVLTVFSVFFLPLTFIVGVYGMNFEYMPELRHHWGYPGVLIGMGVVTLIIYLWFRSRGWLRG
jgi:magnesium transporter